MIFFNQQRDIKIKARAHEKKKGDPMIELTMEETVTTTGGVNLKVIGVGGAGGTQLIA